MENAYGILSLLGGHIARKSHAVKTASEGGELILAELRAAVDKADIEPLLLRLFGEHGEHVKPAVRAGKAALLGHFNKHRVEALAFYILRRFGY